MLPACISNTVESRVVHENRTTATKKNREGGRAYKARKMESVLKARWSLPGRQDYGPTHCSHIYITAKKDWLFYPLSGYLVADVTRRQWFILIAIGG